MNALSANPPVRNGWSRAGDRRGRTSASLVESSDADSPRRSSTGEETTGALRREACFRINAPSARTVKIAGDFTEWDKTPLNLQSTGDGNWQLKMELPPGRYNYRFLVDGEWRDDPTHTEREPNPFGTYNSVLQVR